MAERRITTHFSVKKDSNISRIKAQVVKEEDVKFDDQSAGSLKAQEDGNLNILREFDLNWEFGPCTGITRLERWNRAEKYGLTPPSNVKALLLDHSNEKKYSHSVWIDYEI